MIYCIAQKKRTGVKVNNAMKWVKAIYTAQKMKFFINDFFSKCDQIRTVQHYRITSSYKAKTNISIPNARNYMQKLHTATISCNVFQKTPRRAINFYYWTCISQNRVHPHFSQWP